MATADAPKVRPVSAKRSTRALKLQATGAGMGVLLAAFAAVAVAEQAPAAVSPVALAASRPTAADQTAAPAAAAPFSAAPTVPTVRRATPAPASAVQRPRTQQRLPRARTRMS